MEVHGLEMGKCQWKVKLIDEVIFSHITNLSSGYNIRFPLMVKYR